MHENDGSARADFGVMEDDAFADVDRAEMHRRGSPPGRGDRRHQGGKEGERFQAACPERLVAARVSEKASVKAPSTTKTLQNASFM